MATPDNVIEDARSQLERIFGGIELTPDEKRFVEDCAGALSECAARLLTAVDEERRVRMRPVIIAVALSQLIGRKR